SEDHEIIVPLSTLKDAIQENGTNFIKRQYAHGVPGDFFDKKISVSFIRNQKNIRYLIIKGQIILQQANPHRGKKEVLGKDFDFEITLFDHKVNVEGTYWIPTPSERYTARKFELSRPSRH